MVVFECHGYDGTVGAGVVRPARAARVHDRGAGALVAALAQGAVVYVHLEHGTPKIRKGAGGERFVYVHQGLELMFQMTIHEPLLPYSIFLRAEFHLHK